MEYRNIAIIAHVDHGKTTLVDALLRQTLKLGHGEEITERAMRGFERILADCMTPG